MTNFAPVITNKLEVIPFCFDEKTTRNKVSCLTGLPTFAGFPHVGDEEEFRFHDLLSQSIHFQPLYGKGMQLTLAMSSI